MQNIVAATNFSVNATHAARRAAIVASGAGSVRVELLHVLPPAGRWSSRVGPSDDEMARFKRAHAELRSMVRLVRSTTDVVAGGRIVRGRLKDTIAGAARHADLLVVGAARRPTLFPVAGLTQRLIRTTRVPVLVVRNPPAHRYGRVLVAVDFSTAPEQAIRVARTVAPGARFDVVHAYRGEFEGQLRYAGASEVAVEHHRADARRDAAFRLAELLSSQRNAPNTTSAHVVHGHAASEVLEKERQVGAGLVVVSRSARSVVEELLVPSVTSSLLESGNADVLVVPV
jgi:nucleotide-binding universal stress UspA family protein